MQRVDEDDSPMKHWLDRHGFFVDAEDNYNAWRLLWKVFNGSSFVVNGSREEDPVLKTFNTVKEKLWEKCK